MHDRSPLEMLWEMLLFQILAPHLIEKFLNIRKLIVSYFRVLKYTTIKNREITILGLAKDKTTSLTLRFNIRHLA
jgi:hypothetical protein